MPLEDKHSEDDLDLMPCSRCNRWERIDAECRLNVSADDLGLPLRGREFRCRSCTAIAGIGRDAGILRLDTRFLGSRMVHARPSGAHHWQSYGEVGPKSRVVPEHPRHVHKNGADIRKNDKLGRHPSRKRKRGVGTPLHCTPNAAVVRGCIDGSLLTNGLPPGQYGCYLGKRKKVIGLCTACSKFQMFDAKNASRRVRPVLEEQGTTPDNQGALQVPEQHAVSLEHGHVVSPNAGNSPSSEQLMATRHFIELSRATARNILENAGVASFAEPTVLVGFPIDIVDARRHFSRDASTGVPDYAAAAEAAAVAKAKLGRNPAS